MEFKLFQPQYIHELGKRTNQEDSLYPADGLATEQNRVFIVCDGMGGHDKGEVASAAVCQGLSQRAEALLSADRPFTDDDFLAALKEAFETLDRADTEHAGRMGTTMTFICLHRGGCLAAHIGDSRIYHLRPATGEVLFRSRDHSLVQQLYELGEISYDGMATNPRKNVILRAMQPLQVNRVEPTLVHITDIRPGDYFYLCSDGMLERMEDDEILAIVGDPSLTEEQKVQEFIKRTSENSDNHTAYLVKIAEVVNEAGDEAYLNDEPEARRRNKALNDPRKSEVWDYRPDGKHVSPTRDLDAEDDEEATLIVPPPVQPAAAVAAQEAVAQEAVAREADAREAAACEAAAQPDASEKKEKEFKEAATEASIGRSQYAEKARGEQQPQASNRRNLIMGLIVLGLLAVGVILFLLLKSPAAGDGTDADDEVEMDEQYDQKKSGNDDGGFLYEEGMDNNFVDEGRRGTPGTDAGRQSTPRSGNTDGTPTGETPSTDNNQRRSGGLGGAVEDFQDQIQKNIIDQSNK